VSDSAGLRLLTVHAHPDDETITMGGLLAQCADRGIATSLICCTDGKVATIFDPEYAASEAEIRPRLKEIREEELRSACRILGVSEVHFLEYGDSGMAGTETNQAPRLLAGGRRRGRSPGGGPHPPFPAPRRRHL